MSEGFPRSEAPKPISKKEVVTSLIQNPEDLSPLQAYIEKQEQDARTSKDRLRLKLETARIYRDAGLVDAATKSYEMAKEQAWKEQEDDLYIKLSTELIQLTR